MNLDELYKETNGHKWQLYPDICKHEICDRCMRVRRADDKNPPCTGIMPKLTLRVEIPTTPTVDLD